jgi:hypothetical protein
MDPNNPPAPPPPPPPPPLVPPSPAPTTDPVQPVEVLPVSPTANTNTPNITPSGRGPKIFIGLIVVTLAIGALIGAGVLATRLAKNTRQTVSSPTPEAVVDEMPDFAGITISENTITIAKVHGKYCLGYKGKVYLPQEADSYEPKLTVPDDPNAIPWKGLVDPPTDVVDTQNSHNEVFSFKAYPDSSGFVFIMRWPKAGGERFEMFNFSNNTLSPVMTFDPTLKELAYRVPKIYQLSPNGQLAALNMFDCWECEREYPQTLLVNVISRQNKVLGQTSYFKWVSNGDYEYKDYIAGRALSTIPIKNGKFNF